HTILPTMLPPPPLSTLFPYTTLFRSTFVLFQHPRTGFLGHDGGRGRRAAGAHGQQEIAPGEAPGALGHDCLLDLLVLAAKYAPRSEEHTSELQSLRHLVCRLLLEKKN